MSTNAPVFNYNPVTPNKQRRLPNIAGIEHGYPMDSQSSEYSSPQTAVRSNNYSATFSGIHRHYAPPSPSEQHPGRLVYLSLKICYSV
jgi:hypothetical protein